MPTYSSGTPKGVPYVAILPYVAIIVALLVVAATAPRAQSGDEAALVAKAKGIHERVIALDTHNDIDPENFTAARNYTQRLDTQVDLPKMVEGGLDASFFIVSTTP